MTLDITRRAALLGTLGAAAFRTPLAWGADPITIGCSMPQTGGLASIGKAGLVTLQLFIEDMNARGGVLGRPLQLVTYDDQSNPANVPRIYTKLLDVDKVDLIVTNGTNLTVPAMPVAMERGKVVMAMLALAVNEKFKYPRFFQTMPYGPDGKAAISAGFFNAAMGMNPKPRTAALVGADAEFAKAALSGARAQAKQHGLRIVYDRTYPPSTVDFTPVIRGIAAADPDLVYVGSYPIDTNGMIRAARELNFRPKLFGGGMVGTQAASLKGDLGELLNDVISYELYCPAVARHFPKVEPLLQRYRPLAVQAGVDPQGYYVPPFAYCTLEILLQAVQGTGGTDQEKLAKYLHANAFQTVVGEVRFGEDGEWAKPRMLTVQFRGLKGQGMEQFTNPGAEVVIDPPEYSSGELRYPMGPASQQG
ncbi:MAG TPA: amino acid ABC transporter substrate-binding protein [Crenalkalicoccus sp.]|nr:amino acid ABC transporter substrate-binding protein [Crenalkalicoccus sp.]